MIWVPISISSRGSSAFTLACVPTGMYTGVSTNAVAGGQPAKPRLVCASVFEQFKHRSVIQHRHSAPLMIS